MFTIMSFWGRMVVLKLNENRFNAKVSKVTVFCAGDKLGNLILLNYSLSYVVLMSPTLLIRLETNMKTWSNFVNAVLDQNLTLKNA